MYNANIGKYCSLWFVITYDIGCLDSVEEMYTLNNLTGKSKEQI